MRYATIIVLIERVITLFYAMTYATLALLAAEEITPLPHYAGC